MSSFVLHPQLKADLQYLGELELCGVYLLPDSDNPWIVLVPQVPTVTEWYELNELQQARLSHEISTVSMWLKQKFNPTKINVGALGNRVPQLHVHVIARFLGDKAWPGPIWGHPPGQDSAKIESYRAAILKNLKR